MSAVFDPNPVEPDKCSHYAGFAAPLDRTAFDCLYWFPFVLVIFLLFASSWKYSSDSEAAQQLQAGSPAYRRKMKRCLYVCVAYAAVGVVSVVMEVYALLALQFCNGEDLMSLYWSTWTMLQVGSLIAIFGIILAVFNAIRGAKNPPWALALGTPVLVVAGIGHAMHNSVRKRVRKVRSRSLSRLSHMSQNMLPLSRQDTLTRPGEAPGRCSTSSAGAGDTLILMKDEDDDDNQEDCQPVTPAAASSTAAATFQATVVGFTADGAPIIQFVEDPGPMVLSPTRGTFLGRDEDGQVTIAFRQGMAPPNLEDPALARSSLPPTPPASSSSTYPESLKRGRLLATAAATSAATSARQVSTSRPGTPALPQPLPPQRPPCPVTPRPQVVRILSGYEVIRPPQAFSQAGRMPSA